MLLTPISKTVRTYLKLLPSSVLHVPDDAGLVDYLYITPATWKQDPHPSETVCIDLELFFRAADYSCPCCLLTLPLRCDYCQRILVPSAGAMQCHMNWQQAKGTIRYITFWLADKIYNAQNYVHPLHTFVTHVNACI